MSWCAATALALVLTGCGAIETPAPRPGASVAPATARRLLDRHRPIYVMDARDPGRPTSVDAFISRAVLRTDGGRVLAREPTSRDLRAGGENQVLDGPDGGASAGRPTVYGAVRRQSGRTWLQYWAFLPDNPQDRGVLRTGRHEGDWEFFQIGLDPEGHPEAVTAAQHTWAEGCPWNRVRRDGERPVLFLANGSHATYLSTGEHGRPWPDPDDEARGDGTRADPTLLDLDRQPWRDWGGRWGGSNASALVPVEATSPVGPAFQDAGQNYAPTAFHAAARACGSGAPTAVRDGIAGGVAALGIMGVLWRRRQHGGTQFSVPRRHLSEHLSPPLGSLVGPVCATSLGDSPRLVFAGPSAATGVAGGGRRGRGVIWLGPDFARPVSARVPAPMSHTARGPPEAQRRAESGAGPVSVLHQCVRIGSFSDTRWPCRARRDGY